MVRVELKGIHRVTRKLVDGSSRRHHYAWRGGPKFWSSDSDIKEGSAEYVAALAACVERPKAGSIGKPAGSAIASRAGYVCWYDYFFGYIYSLKAYAGIFRGWLNSNVNCLTSVNTYAL